MGAGESPRDGKIHGGSVLPIAEVRVEEGGTTGDNKEEKNLSS
jgi:hypothetical protein